MTALRFSRAKPTGSFRVFHPSSRRVAAHTDTLAEARKDAEFWTKTTPNPVEIQKRFPSGTWVTIETKKRQFTSAPAHTSATSTKRSLGPRARAHATKLAKTGDKTSDKINVDHLAKMFGLPDWDKIDELNQQHYWEMAHGAGDEEAQMAAESTAQDEVYGKWYDAVVHAASTLFDEHGLELQPTGKQGTEDRRYDFKIVPSASWNAAADKIRTTLNGVGTFHFDDLKDFLSSGPYTARQAVLSHLGTIRSYPEVYGSRDARQLYDQHWR